MPDPAMTLPHNVSRNRGRRRCVRAAFIIVLLLGAVPVWAAPITLTDKDGVVWTLEPGSTLTRNGAVMGATMSMRLDAQGNIVINDGRDDYRWENGWVWIDSSASAPAAPPPSQPAIPAPSAPCGVNPVSVRSGNWSDPATWGGCVPNATDHATVQAGHIVIIDDAVTVTEALVYGQLSACRLRSSVLTAGSIVVFPGGVLDLGTGVSPIPDGVTATVRLSDIPGAVYTHIHGQPGLQPVLHAHGGRIEMHGTGPTKAWTHLAADAAAGSIALSLVDDPTGWKAGDRVLITGTVQPGKAFSCESGSCGPGDPKTFQTEEGVIASIAGRTLTLTAPLTFAHGGIPPSVACKACRQAAVGNLTRNVVVRSLTPDARRGHVHLATDDVTGDKPIVHIAAASFEHLGRPEVGSYGGPHLHMLGNAKDASVTRSVILGSSNVGVRVHQTNFSHVEDNICYMNAGNCFSLEDGSEVYNTFNHNLAVQAHQGTPANPFDPNDGAEGAGFWANNLRNIWTNNQATENTWGYQLVVNRSDNIGDSQGVLPVVDATGVLGPPVAVRELPILTFSGNSATGSLFDGLQLTGGRSLEPSLIDRFTTVDNAGFGFVSQSFNLVYDNILACHNADRLPSSFMHQDQHFYMGQVNATILNSHICALHVDYQMRGYVQLENTTLDFFRRSGEGPSENLISFAGPTAGGFANGFAFFMRPLMNLDTTAVQEIYLWDFDSPGLHIVLHQWGTNSADTLTYTTSSRFGAGLASMEDTLMEAQFTGPKGIAPTFAWPLRIDVGNRPDFAPIPDLTRTDRIVGGKRWRVDSPYVQSPPGMLLPRYGYFDQNDPQHQSPTQELSRMVYWPPSEIGPDILQSTRVADWFQYRVDVPNGDYWVDLGWAENFFDVPAFVPGPWGVGTRMIDVRAQGVLVIDGLDVFATAGPGNPVWRSFPVRVTDQRLIIELSRNWRAPAEASLGAMAVCPQPMVVGGRCP